MAARTLYVIYLRPHANPSDTVDLPNGIAVRDLGAIERDMQNLRRVIVVADKVAKPSSILEEAVEYNFARNVQYTFLVSRDRAQREINGYYAIFKAYAQLVIDQRGYGKVEELVQILRLPYNWDDYPYIFYTVNVPTHGEKTLAFRGDQLHEGIAHHYGRIEPALAHTIARALVSEAPSSLSTIEVERGHFDAGSNVIEFTSPKEKSA